MLGANYFSFLYFLVVNSTYVLLVIVAFFAIRGHLRLSQYVEDKLVFRHAAILKPVSVLAPAFNEELSVVESVQALLKMNYPEYEVILINDGSTDGTLDVLIDSFDLQRIDRAAPNNLATRTVRRIFKSRHVDNLIVIDKENGGKADALNTGINYSRYSHFIAIDTDSILERDALLKMIRPFIEVPETVAVGGIIRIVNGCEVRDGEIVKFGLSSKVLPNFQVVEYFRAFLFGRAGWGSLNMLLIISGAFGVFKKAEVIRVGGYSSTTVGEDIELVVRLHRSMLEQGKPYYIKFVTEPVCWTEAPETLKALGRQRNRWNRGLLETIRTHRVMLFNPAYGRIGLVALPFALIVEGLGGVWELLGLGIFAVTWYLNLLDVRFVVAFLMVAILLGVIASWSAVILDELTYRRFPRFGVILLLLVIGVLENFGYRQLNSWWRVKGLIDLLRGEKAWGRMTRRGFEHGDAGPPAVKARE